MQHICALEDFMDGIDSVKKALQLNSSNTYDILKE